MFGWHVTHFHFHVTHFRMPFTRQSLSREPRGRLHSLAVEILILIIPHICHFFYTGRIFENQILHPRKRLKTQKTLKMSLKKSNVCSFFHLIWKKLHWAKKITQAPLVVLLTNMRYGSVGRSKTARKMTENRLSLYKTRGVKGL